MHRFFFFFQEFDGSKLSIFRVEFELCPSAIRLVSQVV
jgi:hypothetical protein